MLSLQSYCIRLEGLSDRSSNQQNHVSPRVKLLALCGGQSEHWFVYLRKLHLHHVEKLVSVKSISLKLKDFLSVLKMNSLWTPIHKIIVFFSDQNASILKNWSDFAKKQRNNFHDLSLTKKTKFTFCLLFMLFRVKQLYLKCPLNLLLWKK